MNIGDKIKLLRQRCGLTQQELADRAELSKGFISQLERDLTSPSITTLTDILECLGTNLKEFFKDDTEEKLVFSESDMFEKNEEGKNILWMVPNAQKNLMEPIILTLKSGYATDTDVPHDGEEFGYVLSGNATLVVGDIKYKIKKGNTFYFTSDKPHYIVNNSKYDAKILWISSPPTF